jgi:hypothetical protein
MEGFRVAISSYTTLKDVEELGLLEFLQKGRRLGLFLFYLFSFHTLPTQSGNAIFCKFEF